MVKLEIYVTQVSFYYITFITQMSQELWTVLRIWLLDDFWSTFSSQHSQPV